MYIHMPHTFVCPIHSYTHLGVQTPPYVPILLYVSVCSERHLHVVGGCRGPLHVGHLPCMLDTSPYGGCLSICLTPPLIGWLPCASVCLGDIYMLYGEYSPHVGALGVVPHMLGVWGHQHICQALVSGSTSIGCPLCFILYLFCSSLCLT